MKKRTIAIMLATMLAITTAACGNAAEYVDNAVPETTMEASVEPAMEASVETTMDETVEDTTEESMEEPTEASTEESMEETMETAAEENTVEEPWWMKYGYELDYSPWEPGDEEYAELIFLISGKEYDTNSTDDLNRMNESKEGEMIWKRWTDATSGYGTNTLRCWLNIRDNILAEYGVEDQSVYANVPETAETAAEPTAAPVAVAAKIDTTVTAAEPTAAPVTVAALGEALGEIMDDKPVNSVHAANETTTPAAQPAAPAPAAQPAIAETVPAATPAPTVAPAPAPAENPEHVHDWYAVGENVYGEPWEEVVGEHEEWQDVEVIGSRCVVCGWFKEGPGGGDFEHSRNCQILNEDGTLAKAGFTGTTEIQRQLVTVQDVVYHGGDREFHQTGWACRTCGATKGMDE